MISVSGLTKRYGDRAVLDNVSIEVGKGQIVAIMGSSGGGKTTLLKCIAGLIRPTSGRILVDGIDVGARPEEARFHMGLVFQSSALFDYMNVLDNVLFGYRRRHLGSRQDERKVATEILEKVGLAGNERLMPNELSGGMRKRVGVARALVMRPAVMLYDEPTTGLDPVTTYAMDQLMVSVGRSEDVASLIVSHDVTSVFRVADRIAFLSAGRIVFDGTPEAFRKAEHEAIVELVRKSREERFDAEKV
ncbi:MAG: ATP-binding cassette domain-containing protein [Fimbriimonadaceae bacterium]|nr:ATP-binding cassette domain-containing protein [Fimbriimonadaceae bacterium]